MTSTIDEETLDLLKLFEVWLSEFQDNPHAVKDIKRVRQHLARIERANAKRAYLFGGSTGT